VVALKTTNDQLKNHLIELKDYIDLHYQDDVQIMMAVKRHISCDEDVVLPEIKPFSSYLFRLMDQVDIDDVSLYKKAQIDRKLFSKIRSNQSYQPSKKTVFKLILALELTYQEAKELLEYAGFSFSRSSKFDLVVEYCVKHQLYYIYDVNILLYEYTKETL
jgi:hypothetical protein